MTTVTSRNFSSPDELRTPPQAEVSVVSLGPEKVAQFRLEPGWRWTESVKPIAGTETCQLRHVGVVVSGSLHLVCDDGTESDVSPGSAYVIEPGHDAWVTSDDPFIAYEFEGRTAESYARPTR
jgi:uncharacterized cupin superfamily protein